MSEERHDNEREDRPDDTSAGPPDAGSRGPDDAFRQGGTGDGPRGADEGGPSRADDADDAGGTGGGEAGTGGDGSDRADDGGGTDRADDAGTGGGGTDDHDEAGPAGIGGARGRSDEDFDAASFHDDAFEGLELDDHEIEHVRRDLSDLADFEAAFRPEGYRGVAVWCQDCAEEHFYPWDMLRENLEVLIETGETPVHEPAFAPEPERYVPWDYARGYVDALRDAGVDQRLDVNQCPRCQLPLAGEAAQANYCPRCATPLIAGRLLAALAAHGVEPARIDAIMRETGLPG